MARKKQTREDELFAELYQAAWRVSRSAAWSWRAAEAAHETPGGASSELEHHLEVEREASQQTREGSAEPGAEGFEEPVNIRNGSSRITLHREKTSQLLEVHNASVSEVKHYESRGKPGKDAVPQRITYALTGALATPLKAFAERVELGSRFILATNDLARLSSAEILAEYKNQGKAERGFRFLKDPMFCADILYLKKPQRITALLMIMTTCLLVYAALEYRIRQALQEAAASVPDQKGQPANRPTTKWVFELFLDVHVLTINREHPESLIMNLEEDLKRLLELLGPDYAKAYS